VGIVTGATGLILFFTSHGVLQYFLGFLHSQSKGVGFINGLLQREFLHSNILPKDFSLPWVMGSGVLLAGVLYGRRTLQLRSLLMYGLIFVPLLGFILILGAKFPTYYGWMAYIPLAICVTGSLDLDLSPTVRRLAVELCVLASIGGVGLHVLACARDWEDRDYSKVQQFVTSNIRADDRVYVDPQVYYAAKLTAASTLFWDPGTRISFAQKNRLTACVIGPDRIQLLKELGGTWYRTGQEMIPTHTGLFGTNVRWGFLSLPNYRLSIYRRVSTAPPGGNLVSSHNGVSGPSS